MAYIQHTHKKNIAVDRNKRCMLLLFFSFSLSEKDFVIEKGSKKKRKEVIFLSFFFRSRLFFFPIYQVISMIIEEEKEEKLIYLQILNKNLE